MADWHFGRCARAVLAAGVYVLVRPAMHCRGVAFALGSAACETALLAHLFVRFAALLRTPRAQALPLFKAQRD